MSLWEGAAGEFLGGCAAAGAIALARWVVRRLARRRIPTKFEEQN